MREADRDKVAHVIIGEPVDRALATAPERDEPAVTQKTELMADRGLAHTRNACEVAHAKLTGHQCLEQPESRRIGEGEEERGRTFGERRTGQPASGFAHGLLVDQIDRARGLMLWFI